MSAPYTYIRNGTELSSSSFAEGMQALLRERLGSFHAEAPGLLRVQHSPYVDDLTKKVVVDAELLRLAACALRKEYNAHGPPISLLPPEILLLIFQMCAKTERPLPPYNLRARGAFQTKFYLGQARDSYRTPDTNCEFEEPSWMSGRGGSLGYIALSHVCSSWRNVMLGSSALWTDDVGALPDALPIVLNRAGDLLPLTVRLYGSSYRRDNNIIWTTLAANGGALAQRVQTLYWLETREGYLYREVFEQLPMLPFSSLEKIFVWAHELPVSHFEVEPPVLAAPRLRVADFTNMSCIPTTTTLTELSIRTTWPSSTMDIDPWEFERRHFRTILQANSATLLHLFLDFNEDPETAIPNETSINLPSLRRMYIHNLSLGSGRPASLLSNISYSASALSYIHLDQDLSVAADPSELIYLFGVLQQAGIASPYGLAIVEELVHGARDDDDSISTLLRFYSEPAAASSTNLIDEGLFGRGTHRLSLRIDYGHFPIHILFQILSRSISPEGVKTLSYTSSGHCDGCHMKSALIVEHFPAVQTLHLGDPYNHDIAPSLAQLRHAGRMPGLERLWLTQSGTGNCALSRDMLAASLYSRYSRPRERSGLGTPTGLKELRIDRSVTVGIGYLKGAAQSMATIRTYVELLDWCTQSLPIH